MERANQDRLKQSKNITISDIANALEVSKTTVSRAISGKGRISEQTRQKVLAYIREQNYKPNIIAKGLAQSKTYNIGIALPGDYNDVELPFFQSCLMGICDVAYQMDYDILVTVVTENDISQLKRVIMNNKVDGYILTRTLVKDKVAEFLKKRGITFVTIGSLEDKEVIQVDHNHREACKELTSSLIEKGMKRIGLIGGNETHIVNQNRYLGFLDAFESHKVLVNEELIHMNAKLPSTMERMVEQLIEMKADCIICMDDSICLHVLNKLDKLHMQVPKDIKVASFYNSTLLKAYIPSITSLKFDAYEIGKTACKIILDCLEEKEVPAKTLLGYEVLDKESTII